MKKKMIFGLLFAGFMALMLAGPQLLLASNLMVDKTATETLKAMGENGPFRFYLSTSKDWGGAGLKLTRKVGEIKTSDATFTFSGLVFVIDKNLLKKAGPITVFSNEEDYLKVNFNKDILKEEDGGCK